MPGDAQGREGGIRKDSEEVAASGGSGCSARETRPVPGQMGVKVTLFCEMLETHVLPTAKVPTWYCARWFQQPRLFK